jgi:hypothetical protein
MEQQRIGKIVPVMLDSYFILLTTSQFQEKPSQKRKGWEASRL